MRAFALLTCDSVTIEQSSGKHFIFGHFSSIKVNNFPATHAALTIFIGLTGIPAGEHLLQLKWGLPREGPSPVKKFPWDPPPPPDPMQIILTQTLTSTEPEQKIYLISEIKELYFEKAGSYQFALIVDNNPVGEVTLAVS